jgi:hypothetical protein
LKEITLKLRKREKKHYLKVQELHDDGASNRYNQRDKDNFINDESHMQVLE